jgi:hypothetical protein
MHNHQIDSDAEPWAGGKRAQTYNVNINGDFSGDAWIDVDPDRVETFTWEGTTRVTVKIPFEVLEELVGRKHIARAISRLEDKSGRDYLADTLAGGIL